jgi:hypothetical protein
MKKYPWEFDKEIDWSAEPIDIVKQYQDMYFIVVDRFIDRYFISKVVKAACYTGWIIAAILGYCLVAVSK